MADIKLLPAILVLMLSVSLFFVCCSEDEDEPIDSNYESFINLSPQEQAEMAEVAVKRCISFVPYVQTMAYSTVTYDEWYFYIDSEATSANKAFRHARSIAAPPNTNWEGPDAEGWYSYDKEADYFGMLLTTIVEIRWTPDVWNDAQSMGPVIKMEMNHSKVLEYKDIQYMKAYKVMVVEVNDARSHVSGTATSSTSTSDDGKGSVDIDMDVTWLNVPIETNNHEGDYSFDLCMIGSYFDEEIEEIFYGSASFSMTFSFNQDGSGIGSAFAGTDEVIQFIFSPNSDEYYSGYFLLASEDFLTQHAFGLYPIYLE